MSVMQTVLEQQRVIDKLRKDIEERDASMLSQKEELTVKINQLEALCKPKQKSTLKLGGIIEPVIRAVPPETPQFTASILETPTQRNLLIRPHNPMLEEQENMNENSLRSSRDMSLNVDSMQAKLDAIRRSKAALEAKMKVYER